jgi:hypothetical protein
MLSFLLRVLSSILSINVLSGVNTTRRFYTTDTLLPYLYHRSVGVTWRDSSVYILLPMVVVHVLVLYLAYLVNYGPNGTRSTPLRRFALSLFRKRNTLVCFQNRRSNCTPPTDATGLRLHVVRHKLLCMSQIAPWRDNYPREGGL